MRTLFKFTATLVAFTLLFGFCLSTRANVYATNIKFNGTLANIAAAQSVTISYILNEPATAGVTLNILSGTTIIRTFVTASSPAGTNSVVWNLKDNSSNAVPLGAYSVEITASAAGYSSWTQISHDTNLGNYVFYPEGLAVNRNTNSPYYGRVFIGNAMRHTPTTIPGNNDTILKFNADGSFADEGPSGNGGYPIQDNGLGTLPYKLRSGGDDRLYMLDWSGSGTVVAFDMALTTNQVVLSPANYVNNPYSVIVDNEQGWGAMDITFAGTANGRIWLGDTDPDGEGIWYWQLTNGIANPSDTTGSQAVTSAGPLTQPVTGFMVDTNLDVFVGQQVTDAGDTNNVAMEFTHLPATTATWEAGSGNNAFLDINDATIDSRQAPTFVAIALDGPTTGGVQILNAANGRSEITLDPADDYAVTAWDDVGNVYIASPTINRWRVYSPPDGPNQFTTHSAITVQLVTPVTILSVANSNGNVVVTFTAGTTDSASSFTLQSAPTVLGPYTNVSGAIIAMSSPGVFTATAPSPGTNTFYRIARAPAL